MPPQPLRKGVRLLSGVMSEHLIGRADDMHRSVELLTPMSCDGVVENGLASYARAVIS